MEAKYIKIRLVGEYPTDTKAVENLLKKHIEEVFSCSVKFISMIGDMHGDKLNPKTEEKGKVKRMLRIEFESEKPTVVIFIRDLDSIRTCADFEEKLKLKKEYFAAYRSIVGGKKKAIFMLNIWELETLILGDIATFNQRYECKVKEHEHIHLVENPKEILKEATKGKYNQSQNPDLFSYLSFDKISSKSKNFRIFVEKVVRLSEKNF